MYQILHRDGLARVGELTLGNKKIRTPALLPVIHPIRSEPWLSEAKKMNLEGIITNSYILKKSGFENEDVHDHLNFDGIIMTDSGTFQEHMYGQLPATNLEMVNYQGDIGSDIVTIRDVFSEPDYSEERIKEDTILNYNRGREAINATDKYIALPVQGGVFMDQRRKSASLMSSLGGEYYPVGGLVPLMEGYRYSTVCDIILNSKMELKNSSVVHAFGAGHPMFFPLLFLLGVDVVDSSAYIKYAREDRILNETGTIDLRTISEELPSSPFLDGYSVKELQETEKEERERALALHNLYVSVKEIRKIREQIRAENIWNYVEYRSRSHPLLLEAYRKVLEHYEFIEKFEPKSRRRPLFYTGPETLLRPEIRRFTQKESLDSEGVLVLGKPYSYFIDKPVSFVNSPFGTISIYLDETYPVAQSIFPGEYYEQKKDLDRMLDQEWQEFFLDKINYIFKYQFGKELFSLVDRDNIEVVRSKNTGKIRNVLYAGNIILSLRASDGLYSINYEGSKIIHKSFPFPEKRVAVSSEIQEFITTGRNVFAKFVEDCDPSIRPGDEVLIVDKEDNLLSYGRAILNRDEMIQFSQGVAVKNRIKSKETSE